MSVKNISNTVFIIGLFLLSSCSKERNIVDLSYNENFKIEKIDSTGTTLFLKIQVDNYTFKNATDSVEYGLIYSYIDKFGYEVNQKEVLGKFLGELNLTDTLKLDFSFIRTNFGYDLNIQYYCYFNGVFDKSKKISAKQNSFFLVLNDNLGPKNITNPFLSTWNRSNEANEGRYTNFFSYPNLYYYDHDWQSVGHYGFNVISGNLGSPSSLYNDYVNSSFYQHSTRLFTVGSKYVIRRDSVYGSPAFRQGKLSIIDFENNRYDMTGPTFPTTYFYQNLPADGSYWFDKKTLRSLFWFDFGTYSYVLLGGYNSTAANALTITKFVRFNGVTEQFEGEEIIPTQIQSIIDNSVSGINSFITFNNLGFINAGNLIYMFNPNSSIKWTVFPETVEGVNARFIPHKGKLYFLTDSYVYLLDQDLLNFKKYINSSLGANLIVFPYLSGGEIKTYIYGPSSFNGSLLEFNP
jgi:hypothetical protein